MNMKRFLVLLLFLSLSVSVSYFSWAETANTGTSPAAAEKSVPEGTKDSPSNGNTTDFKPVQKWKPVKEQSHINFTGIYQGKLFSGHFTDFDADIIFDPAQLDKSSLLVVIETGSVKLDDDVLNSSVTGSNWLNVRNFPQAIFKSTRIDFAYKGEDGLDQYSAYGKFSLGGVEKDFILPFVVKFVRSNAYAYGEFPLKRMDFGIGAAVDPNGSMVSSDILVKFDINAVKFEPVRKP